MKNLPKFLSGFMQDKFWPVVRGRLPLFILGTALLVTTVMILTRPRDVPAARSERAWTVDVLPVNYGSINPTLELFGSVQSPQDADLSAGIEATVNDVPIRDGETVVEGQLLVVLDDRDANLTLRQRQADILEIQAQSSFADRQIEINRVAFKQEKDLLDIVKTRFDRAKELLDLGRLSRSDFENATENLKRGQLALNRADLALEESRIRLNERQAQLERAQALHGQAALDVARTRVLAPFGGIVSGVQVSEGDRVRVGDSLMRLQNPSSVEVRTQVPADYVQSINQGLLTKDAISAAVEMDDGIVMGRITRVSGLIREGSGGVDSFIGFYSPPLGLRLGSTVRVLVQLPAETGVIGVPAEAVYGRDRVYKVVNDRMKKVDVERVGERSLKDGRTEVIIRSPELTSSDAIIVTKIANAADGLLVKMVGKKTAASHSSQGG
jgi:HlyD family secretion protein